MYLLPFCYLVFGFGSFLFFSSFSLSCGLLVFFSVSGTPCFSCLIPLFRKQKTQGSVPGNSCGDLAGNPNPRNRAPSHLMNVEGNLNNDAHWLLTTEFLQLLKGSHGLRVFSIWYLPLVVQRLFIQPSVVQESLFSMYVYIWEGVKWVHCPPPPPSWASHDLHFNFKFTVCYICGL